MAAALSRYANPESEIGHAGPDAPVHEDQRLEVARAFAADLPLIAEEGLRTKLLQRDADRLERTRQMLCDALADLLREHALLVGNDHRHVVAARRALTLASLG
jgi:hypothetical protein